MLSLISTVSEEIILVLPVTIKSPAIVALPPTIMSSVRVKELKVGLATLVTDWFVQ